MLRPSRIARRIDSLVAAWTAGGRRISPVLRRAFGALVGGTILITVASTLFNERQQFLNAVSTQNEDIAELLKQRQADHTAALRVALTSLAANPDLRTAFISRNREKLLAAAMPIFEQWKSLHGISHFYFTDSERINFLRVHNPDHSGDQINRRTTLQAAASGTFADGLEFGATSVFTLRVVMPWQAGLTRIGFLELGMEIGHFFSNVEERAGVKLIEAYNKEALDWETWLQATALHRNSSWELSRSYALAATQLSDIPDGLAQKLDEAEPGDAPLLTFAVSGTRLLHYSSIPLNDSSGTNFGNLIVVRDTTPEAVASINAVLATVLPLLSLGLLTWLIIARISHQMQRTVLSAHNRLEDKVEGRTRELRDSMERLNEARKVAGFGNWDWTIETNELVWSEEIYRIFGLEPDDFRASYDAFLERVHAEDRQLVQTAVHDAVERNKPYDLEHRIVRPDGQQRTVHEWGKVLVDADNKPVRMIGIVQDITRRKALEEELTLHRDTLQQKVDNATTDLKLKARELEFALAREKELREVQREFVSMASHEFRTPLAIIDQSAQRLMRNIDKGKWSSEFALRRLDNIRGAVMRMARLMDSTLTAARLDEGKISFELQRCDVASLVRDVCERQQEISHAHDVRCDVEDLPEAICADDAALDRIFTNLLSNAVKYSPDGGVVEVTGRTEGSDAVISIRDQGLGIDESDIPKLFSRFFRAKTSLGIAGTGIGLHMVKTLAEMHDGSVDAESKKGKGSTFSVRLPIAGPAIDPGQEASAA